MLSDYVRWGMFKTCAVCFVCFALALALIPFASVQPAEAQDDSAWVAEEIAALLAAGEYAEGEAIVIMDASASADTKGVQPLNADMLSSSETLLSATENTYQAALEGIPVAHAAEDAGSLRALSTSEESIAVKYVAQHGMSTQELLTVLWSDPRVLSAEPNYIFEVGELGETLATLNNLPENQTLSLTDYQWGMDNNSTANMTEEKALGFDINPPHWNTQTDNATGTVAVVDSGIDYTHPDLKNVMRTDMQNYVSYGGPHGYNALEGADPTDPMDDNFHGTHCAGIIAAEWNDFGASGVASGVELIAVKVGTADGRIPNAAILRGYEYLTQAVLNDTDGTLNLKAINNSWGGPELSKSFALAVTKIGALGVVTIKASGNSAKDTDITANDGSLLQSNPYAVIVNSSAMDGTLSDFSNYGKQTTDIVAPGSDILSTMPQNMPRYIPSAVDPASGKNLVFESFDAGAQAFKTYFDIDSTIETGELSDANYYDSNKKSWLVKLSDMDEVINENGAVRTLVAKIEVPAALQDQVGLLALSTYVTGGSGERATIVDLLMQNSDGALGTISAASEAPKGSWMQTSLNLSAAREQGFTPAFNQDNCLTIHVQLLCPDKAFEDTDCLYIDAVGVGTADAAVAYGFSSGTSMAAPAATGAAMILASDINPSLPASDKALLCAAQLNGCVRPLPQFADICTSGGSLDLDSFVNQNFAPVITSAETSTHTQQTQITLQGFYFGANAGTVHIGGTQAQVTAWEDRQVTLVCPTHLASGIHEIELTTYTGAVGTKSFLLNLPSPLAAPTTPLFEKEYSLPYEAGFPEGATRLSLVGLGGYLYVVPDDGNSESIDTVSALWQLNPTTGSWVRCADLPIAVSWPSVTTFEGKLAMTAHRYGQPDAGQVLCLYDPASNLWSITSLPTEQADAALLTNCQGSLIFIGGLVDDEGTDTSTNLNTVYTYDAVHNTFTHFATLNSGYSAASSSVAVHNDTIFVMQADGSAAEVISWPSGAVTALSSSSLPVYDAERSNSIAAAPVADGIMLSGASALEAQGLRALAHSPAAVESFDTYLLAAAGLGSSSPSLSVFSKRVSQAQLFYTASTAHRGALYAAGISYFEPNTWVLRATAVATLNQPGDITSGTNGDDGNKPAGLPPTGDMPGLTLLIMLIMAGTGGAVVYTAKRQRKVHTRDYHPLC